MESGLARFFDAVCLAIMFALLPMVFEGYMHRRLDPVERLLVAIVTVFWLMAAVGTFAEALTWTGLAIGSSVALALLIRFRDARRTGQHASR